jgi:hypothetical protein
MQGNLKRGSFGNPGIRKEILGNGGNLMSFSEKTPQSGHPEMIGSQIMRPLSPLPLVSSTVFLVQSALEVVITVNPGDEVVTVEVTLGS